MKIMLDTSAYVGFKRNIDEAVELIAGAGLVLLSAVVLGELMFGFRNGTRFRENMKDLHMFLDHEAVELVEIGRDTADRYARIAAGLKTQGTPIPTNDIWIAAHAMEHGAELVTSDCHFEEIAGLVYTMF
ncbi:MAG: type II toxin-antitoxin system VapC family toxin [Deltaproteobacteria bacterium]|nr:type II toxin-antitoxin system VapC family toxin [Deltaproteobacteria bacterium]